MTRPEDTDEATRWSRMTRAEIEAAKERHPSGKRQTPRRTIRVPDDLWEDAGDVAFDRGDTLSDVVRRALEQYIADNPPGALAAEPAPAVVSYPLFIVER